jgi:hypothetical protein
MRSISKTIAWLCLLLTISSALAFAVHDHSSALEAAKCTVCVAAHSAAPQAVAILTPSSFVFASVSPRETVSTKQRLIAFALRVRPPPSV